MAQSETSTLGVPLELRPARQRSMLREVVGRLIREKPLGLFGAVLVLMFFVMAAASPIITPHGPNETGVGPRLGDPSFDNIMGTDNLRRDIFSRVVYGARVSVTIGLVATLLGTTISLTIGVLSGFFGGWVDILAQRLVDAFIAFPGLVFIISVAAVFADSSIPGLPKEGVLQSTNVILAIVIGILLGVGSSRIIRSAALTVKAQPFVEASRATGATNSRLILTHVLPNVMAPVITLLTLGLGTAILLESSLSFIGLGVTPDTPTWGGMLNREARSFMTQNPWLAIFPGAALSLAIFGFNMLGDALRDLLDPRLRSA